MSFVGLMVSPVPSHIVDEMGNHPGHTGAVGIHHLHLDGFVHLGVLPPHAGNVKEEIRSAGFCKEGIQRLRSGRLRDIQYLRDNGSFGELGLQFFQALPPPAGGANRPSVGRQPFCQFPADTGGCTYYNSGFHILSMITFSNVTISLLSL